VFLPVEMITSVEAALRKVTAVNGTFGAALVATVTTNGTPHQRCHCDVSQLPLQERAATFSEHDFPNGKCHKPM